MFKADLIEKEDYYRARKRLLIFSTLYLIPFTVGIVVPDVSLTVKVIALALYVVSLVLIIRSQKVMSMALGSRRIEIDGHRISIKNRDGKKEEVISIEPQDRIAIPAAYEMPQSSTRSVWKELKGEASRNYLELRQPDGADRRFEFEIDSFYMIEQMKKAHRAWEERGVEVVEGKALA